MSEAEGKGPKRTLVWYQNLRGFIEGTFPADDRWKRIFLERLTELVENGGWRDISSAPKDGTMVLLFCGEDCGVMLARWIAPCDFLNESEYAEDLGDWEDEDWFFADFVAGGRVSNDGMPTHWMPLPKPPLDTERTG